MFKLLFKNSLIYAVVPQLPGVASFFLLPFITPFLTQIDYGVIGIIDVYIGLIGAIHFLGFNVVITNAFINYPNRYHFVWRQLFGFLLQWSIVYILILGLVMYFTIPIEAKDNLGKILFLKIVPTFLFSPISLFMVTYYRMTHNAWSLSYRLLLTGIIGIGFNYYFIAIMKLGYMGWLYSSFIAGIIGGVLYLYPFFFELKMYPIFNFKKKQILKALKIGLPVLPHNYSHFLLNSSDRLIMERYKIPIGEIGIYSFSYTLGMYIIVFANAINQAVSPNLLGFIKESKWEDYKKLVSIFQSAIFLLCLYASLFVKEWMPLLIRNEELNQYPEIFIIIALSYSAWPLYSGWLNILFYQEKTNILWRISTIAGFINVILNIILIPLFGFKVAAWTTFFAMLYQSFSGFLFKQIRESNKANLSPFFWFLMVLSGIYFSITLLNNDFIVRALAALFFTILVLVFMYKKFKFNLQHYVAH